MGIVRAPLDARVPALAAVAIRGRDRARCRVLGEVVGRHGRPRRADPVGRVGDDAATPRRGLGGTGVGSHATPGEPRPDRRVRGAAGRRLHDRVPAVVPPFRLEPQRLVGEPDRDARLPPQPEDHGARRRDEHVHTDPPLLLARLDVALHAATRQLHVTGRGIGHRAGPRSGEPGDLLGEPVGRPVRRA